MKLQGFRINGEGPYFTNQSINKYLTDYGIDRARFADGVSHMGTIVSDVFEKYYVPNNPHKLTGDSLVYVNDKELIAKIIELGFTTRQSVKSGKLQLIKTVLATVVLQDSGAKIDDFYTDIIAEFYFDGIELMPAKPYKQPKGLFIMNSGAKPDKWHGGKVIDEFTPAEQDVIRRYGKRCKETRPIRGTIKHVRKFSK